MMTIDELEFVLECSEAKFLMPRDVFDGAILGITERDGGEQVIAYDSSRVVHALMDAYDWGADEATDWFEVNMVCSYAGSGTPVFIYLCVNSDR